MHSDVAISVKNLTKTYRIFDHPTDRIKQALTFGRRHFHREFTALQDISFEIKKGEAVGIIGRNGSGKSTLLQLICGILKPTLGSIKVHGRIAALLELGSGFNPEFTGRENIYFQGAITGLTQHQINERITDIIKFADIGEFIDQPVRTYSSGMFVRLAFAVNTNVDADILVIDEALAVGDVFFQQKCMRYLRKFQSQGGTILFVSHDTGAVVGLCEKALLLSRDSNVRLHFGSAKEACQIYVRQLYSERSTIDGIKSPNESTTETATLGTVKIESTQPSRYLTGEYQSDNTIQLTSFRSDAESFGHGGIKITDVWFEDKDNNHTLNVSGGQEVNFFIKVESMAKIQWPAFGFTIKDYLGQYIFSEGTDLAFRKDKLTIDKDDIWVVKYSFVMPILIQGDYSINVAVAEGVGDDHIQHHWIEDAITLHSIKSRLIHGICGVQNLNLEIKIFPINAHLQS